LLAAPGTELNEMAFINLKTAVDLLDDPTGSSQTAGASVPCPTRKLGRFKEKSAKMTSKKNN
jgi:hypothetical protein